MRESSPTNGVDDFESADVSESGCFGVVVASVAALVDSALVASASEVVGLVVRFGAAETARGLGLGAGGFALGAELVGFGCLCLAGGAGFFVDAFARGVLGAEAVVASLGLGVLVLSAVLGLSDSRFALGTAAKSTSAVLSTSSNTSSPMKRNKTPVFVWLIVPSDTGCWVPMVHSLWWL